jgi:predicted ArsR family transcriptional regulator
MEAGSKPPSRPFITDARTMRALAHPLRVRLVELIRRDGEITATRAAELLDESPGNMSWHLQTLAKYGFIEEAGGGRGRSRPWRMTRSFESFDTSGPDAEAAAAGEALERTEMERTSERMREWWTRRRDYPIEWRRAAFMANSVAYLTADELAAMTEEIVEIYSRYRDRADRAQRPPDALPVELFAVGHPIPPTAAGN